MYDVWNVQFSGRATSVLFFPCKNGARNKTKVAKFNFFIVYIIRYLFIYLFTYFVHDKENKEDILEFFSIIIIIIITLIVAFITIHLNISFSKWIT